MNDKSFDSPLYPPFEVYVHAEPFMPQLRPWYLTKVRIVIIISAFRGMAKFGIALGSGPRGLGFESRYSDQKSGDRFCGYRIFLHIGIRKDGTSPKTGAKKCPVDAFLVRERIPGLLDASSMDVDNNTVCISEIL